MELLHNFRVDATLVIEFGKSDELLPVLLGELRLHGSQLTDLRQKEDMEQQLLTVDKVESIFSYPFTAINIVPSAAPLLNLAPPWDT